VPGSNIFEAAGYVRSRPDLAEPDTQLVFCAAFRKPGGTIGIGHGYCVGIVALQPKSRGSVTLSGPRAADAPVIDPNLLSHEDDLRVLATGVETGRRLLAAPAFSGKGEAEIAPGSGVRTRDEIEAHVRRSVNTAFHPVGTCAMGPNAVVDHALKVRGVEGLRVADASIMPSITSGNTHAPTVMIGEKCADMIRGRTTV
jgi:choline dehydrogenase-like flavoprotein